MTSSTACGLALTLGLVLTVQSEACDSLSQKPVMLLNLYSTQRQRQEGMSRLER